MTHLWLWISFQVRVKLCAASFFFRAAASELALKLLPWDVAKAVVLALGLSFVVTIFPARRAARLNPVEALRYE